MYKINKKIISGFTLIEALVAISILMIAISSPIMLAQKGLSSSILSRDQMIASFLAQDGIESIKNLRDEIAINQKSFTVPFVNSNGEDECSAINKICVKTLFGDSEVHSCEEDLDNGFALCTEGTVDWLAGELQKCVCNLDGDFCDFDTDGNIYCNIDSSNMSVMNTSDIYASFEIGDNLFKKYSIDDITENKTKFNRKINVRKIGNNEAEIKARIYWDSPYGVQKIEIKTFMYNFESILIKP